MLYIVSSYVGTPWGRCILRREHVYASLAKAVRPKREVYTHKQVYA